MNAEQLYREGRLAEAIASAAGLLRDDPGNERLRTFLIEMLCFAGEYERADKHLELLGGKTRDRQMGALHLRAALQTALTREEMFEKNEVPEPPAGAPVRGKLNGTAFESLTDADQRIGARLEVFAAGNYLMLPFSGISVLSIHEPRRVRDLLWAPAVVNMNSSMAGGMNLGDVLLPVIAPMSCGHSDDMVKLGRVSVWESDGTKEFLFGQKLLLVDGEEFPLLEVRSLEIHAGESSGDGTA
jgi:type VI secretion system protein ImpE